MSKNIFKKTSSDYHSKIFGKYLLDEKGKAKKNKLGEKVRGVLGKFHSRVSHFSRKSWEGRYSDMLEMKAYRLAQLKERRKA